MLKRHLVYIVTNRFGDDSFTRRYRMGRLIHFELHADKANATARERQLKGWVRRKKIAMINESNPAWADLLPVVREVERRRQTLRLAQGGA